MKPEEIISKTQEAIAKMNAINSGNNPELIENIFYNNEKTFEESLPTLTEEQFLIRISFKNNEALFCVRELMWFEALDIDTQSYRINKEDKTYFEGEYEKRETLNKAIVWVADLKNQQIKYNQQNILKYLKHDMVDKLWNEYSKIVSITLEEANALYESAQKYFKGEAQTGFPVPPLVVEVDFMLKQIVSLSREEFRKITISDLERIQLILTARADILGLYSSNSVVEQQKQEMSNDVLDTLPPHMRNLINRGN